MERKWLEIFYKECGREVSLAYNVLNHSNSWGVTLATAALATGVLGSGKFESGKFILFYPTVVHWFFVILAWIIMFRFFIRSALGLANMYRWNELISATSKVLSLPEDHPYAPILNKNCAKKIDAYFYEWRSPRKKKYIVWRNLKLMYFWFFLIILTLFLWGLIKLEKDLFYWLGVAIFLFATIIEVTWFNSWHGFQYKKLELDEEPSTRSILEQSAGLEAKEPSGSMILGFCEEGPYKHAKMLLENPTINWIPWNYQSCEIEPTLLPWLSNWKAFHKRKVLFASWNKEQFEGKGKVVRSGRIDYFHFDGRGLRLTVHLDDLDKDAKRITINVTDPEVYCFMGGI